MKQFYKFLFAVGLCQHFIVEDGAGGGDIGDIEIDIDDENLDGGGEEETDKSETSTGERILTDDVLKLQQQLKVLQDDRDTREANASRDSIIGGLNKKYEEFDVEKVRGFLQELHKTDPQKAEELNTGTGWELIHLQEFAPTKIDNDDIGFGRNGGGVDRSEEVREKLKAGGRASMSDKTTLLSGILNKRGK